MMVIIIEMIRNINEWWHVHNVSHHLGHKFFIKFQCFEVNVDWILI